MNKMSLTQLDQADPHRGFGSPEDRKAVELAAEDAVIAYYSEQRYRYQRTTHIPCGYDFIFTRKESALHVEVKGMAGTTPRFFLTHNEHHAGLMLNPNWRLAMVTSALSDLPQVTVYDPRQLNETFNIEPYGYIGKFSPKPES
jgi:hypothetical protein